MSDALLVSDDSSKDDSDDSSKDDSDDCSSESGADTMVGSETESETR